MIESNHLSKFADLDGSGREILYPMLKAPPPPPSGSPLLLPSSSPPSPFPLSLTPRSVLAPSVPAPDPPQAWGVDTIVLLGSWTDDCIAATAFDAVDRRHLLVRRPAIGPGAGA